MIQLLGFILTPGLFISVFSSINSVYTSIAHGTFDLTNLLPQIIVSFAVIPITLFFGRFFCGFICSFGSMGDLFWYISKKLRKRPELINEKADRVLKSFKYLFLIFIVIFIWTLGAVTIDNTYNPWNIFGMYASLSGWPSASGLLTVGAAILLLIIIGSFFIERFFCRYVCPLGAVFAVLSKLRFLKVRKPSENCGNCRLCTLNCPAGISMYKYDKINSGECINCFKCVSVCPRKNAQAGVGAQDIAPFAAGLTAAAAIIGLYYVGRTVSDNTTYTAPITAINQPVSENSASGQYTDGTYAGSADGFRGTTNLQVTVNNGYIADISVISTGDDEEFFNKAKSTVINEILASQSTEVDAVTGATYSSNAIIKAVTDALGLADTVVTASVDTPSQTEIAKPSPSESAVQSAAAGTFIDGTYTGTGTGFRGETKVSVTVKGGKISDIEILSYNDDREFFDRASSTVINNIIKSQSVNVNAVSGATFSSNGIMEAVANALGTDFTRSIEFSNPGRHSRR